MPEASKKKNRVIIQYNANTSASIRYEEKQNRIVLDHLIPLKENQQPRQTLLRRGKLILQSWNDSINCNNQRFTRDSINGR